MTSRLVPGGSLLDDAAGGDSRLLPGGPLVKETAGTGAVTKTTTHSINSAIQKQNDTKTVSINSAVQKSDTKTHNVDSAVQKSDLKTHDINSVLQKSDSETHDINSALQKAFNVTHSIDSNITSGLEQFYGRPIEDVSAGNWLPSTGADLYATIDEEVPSDTDYNYTTSASTFEVKLTPLADPSRSTGHTVYFRIPAGFSPAGNLKVSLRQGTSTEIAVAYNGTVAADTDYHYHLSGAEADSITDYTDLRLRFEAS